LLLFRFFSCALEEGWCSFVKEGWGGSKEVYGLLLMCPYRVRPVSYVGGRWLDVGRVES
jgi:hypothetical protein